MPTEASWNGRVPLNQLLLCKLAARFQRFPLLGLQTIAALYRQSHSDLTVAKADFSFRQVDYHNKNSNGNKFIRKSPTNTSSSSYSVLNYLR